MYAFKKTYMQTTIYNKLDMECKNKYARAKKLLGRKSKTVCINETYLLYVLVIMEMQNLRSTKI